MHQISASVRIQTPMQKEAPVSAIQEPVPQMDIPDLKDIQVADGQVVPKY